MEHVLTNLPDIASFACTTKYIKHPYLMLDLNATVKAKNAQA